MQRDFLVTKILHYGGNEWRGLRMVNVEISGLFQFATMLLLGGADQIVHKVKFIV